MGCLLLASSAASLWAFGVLAGCPCGCVSAVCWANGFMAFLPVLSSPACSGFASSCGFSSPIWFTPFAMGVTPVGSRLVCPRSERRFVCFPFPFGLFLLVVTALGVLVTIWVSVLVGSSLCAPDGFRWCYAFSPSGWASCLCLRLLFAPCRFGLVSW